MSKCPNCTKTLKRDIENVYEIDDIKYFDIRLNCSNCGYSKPVTVKRKDPVPKAPDAVTEMTASLKLRDYMPKRKKISETTPAIRDQEKVHEKHSKPFRHTRETLFYLGAISLGIGVEVLGLYFESYLRNVGIFPFAGFFISLLIFVFGPIIIVGSAVYYVTKDRMKAILLGSMAVPLSIIVIANLGI